MSHLHLRRRCSKAQSSFFNILRIISAFPTPQTESFLVDLNLRLTETAPTTSFHHSVTETDNILNTESAHKTESEEKASEHSEISDVEDNNNSSNQTSGIVDYTEVSKLEENSRDEGYLNLLIEAAQLILADDDSGSKTERKPAARRKRQCCTEEAEWYAEFVDTSPVVKSKRGRNQVLPFRYRDSVVEPLVRWSSPATASFRSISVVTSKRRSK